MLELEMAVFLQPAAADKIIDPANLFHLRQFSTVPR